jgi:hypothetical protein
MQIYDLVKNIIILITYEYDQECSQEFLMNKRFGAKIGPERVVAEGVVSQRNVIFPLIDGGRGVKLLIRPLAMPLNVMKYYYWTKCSN